MLRLMTSFATYFILSLFDSLLALAFQLKVNRKFGNSGFLVFWCLNFCGMCTMGMALEGILTLLGVRGIPLFVLMWILANVSVIAFPIEVLPVIYRYGYAMPFYYVSKASRTIIFGTKNQVGFCFGILLVWIAGSCILLILCQILSRRWDIAGTRRGEGTIAPAKGEQEG